ncbi:MAG: PD-(D/E)XK nuclease family protein [Pyrinomonadaceae bacterium]
MTVRRSSPYVSTTWLSKLLVGEQSCEWAAWFRANHERYERAPSTFDSTGWRLAHTALLDRMYGQLIEAGQAVSVEAQNRFSLQGKCATLKGKPDLIGLNGSGTICDVKTGQPKASDQVQVMIYMWATPLAFPKYSGVRFDGLVVYPDHEVSIPAGSVDSGFVAKLADLIKRVSADTPPRRVPSADECKFCDLTVKDCLERVEAEAEGLVTTEAF